MRSRWIAPLVAGALCAASAPSAHADGARLTPSGGASFPQRGFVLTLPSGSTPNSTTTRVLENGQPVHGLRVTPANDRFAVLLLIDTSGSMRGKPIRAAMAAARALAAQRPAAQSLGVITFDSAANVLLKPTRDSAAIDAALVNRPALHPGTHIYDAVAAAAREVDPSRFDAAAVVVLSDGSDLGSTTTPAAAAAAARDAHVHLFTVGLRSGAFSPSTLTDLAQLGGGEYIGAATPGALAGIYRRLGGELANAYLISYLSTASAGAPVLVTARAGQELATSNYVAPKLRVAGALEATPKPHQPGHVGFLGTRAGASLVAGVILLFVLLLVATVLHSRARRQQLRERVADYHAIDEPVEAEVAYEPSATSGSAFSRSPRGARLQRSLDIARMEVTPERFVLNASLVTIAVAVLAGMITGSGFVTFICLLLGPLCARAFLQWRVRRQRRLFADQLGSAIQTVASAMRTGYSLVGALAQFLENAPEPSASEFRRVIADEQLGVTLEASLNKIVERMDNRDLRQVALVTVIQRETGGNAAEALDRVADNIRVRDDLRRLVRSLTAQGRMAQGVLSAMPVFTLFALKFVGGAEMDPLFKTWWGHLLLLVAALMVAGGSFWIGRIVKVEV